MKRRPALLNSIVNEAFPQDENLNLQTPPSIT
jgi:hypothetical protein